MNTIIFLTGGSGFVGQNLLPRLLEKPDTEVVLLLRASSDDAAVARLRVLLAGTGDEPLPSDWLQRVSCVRGDVCLPHLGLESAAYAALARRVTHIVHAAATTDFSATLSEARRVNVCGTQAMLDFAMQARATGRFQRFVYVSTAYVSGSRKGLIPEETAQRPRRFSNAYELSKFEADSLVRGSRTQLPVVIARPSIIVGDAHTGRTCDFNGLYSSMRLLTRGLLPVLPGSADTPVDLVSVDYVAGALRTLTLDAPDAAGQVFHLVAGRAASSAGEVVELARVFFRSTAPDGSIRRVLFLPAALIRAGLRLMGRRAARTMRLMERYTPYISVRRVYDDSNTRRALRTSGLAPLPFASYSTAIFAFCVSSDWGRRRPAPPRGI